MINIVVPMAGLGTRFKNENYKTPKPFIEVFDKSLIEWSLENLQFENARFIFIVRKEHFANFPNKFKKLAKYNSVFSMVDETTEGQASSVYIAKKYIDNENPLFIANCDQYIEWNINKFIEDIKDTKIDGAIVTFTSNNPAFSYAKLNIDGYVSETAEKKVISDFATTGHYYWAKGNVFIKSYEQMFNKNIRVNNEFYVCPVYNETIRLGYNKIITFPCDNMYSLGTPKDLEKFIKIKGKINDC